MLSLPTFDSIAIVGDQAKLVAEIASLFSRQRRYLPILDGPRMSRSDWSNEVIRRTNVLSKCRCRRVILADLSTDSETYLSQQNADGLFTSVHDFSEAVTTLKGWVKVPSERLIWGNDNLGVGLLLARRSRQYLQIAPETKSTTPSVLAGKH